MKRQMTTTIIALNLLLGLLIASTTPSHAQSCSTPSFAPAANFGVGVGPRSAAVGDFNLDGKPDLAVGNFSSGTLSVLLGDGGGGFGAATNFVVGLPQSIAVGDFNLDGKPDLATANGVSIGSVQLRLGDGSGGFGVGAWGDFGVGTDPGSVVVGDFNLDGKPDLATSSAGSNWISVLLGNGIGGFAPAVNIDVGVRTLSLAVGDFNLDGKPDLAAANGSLATSVSVLLGNGSGGFGAASYFGVVFRPNFIAVGDFNLDGKPDLATASADSDTVSVLSGDGSGGFGAAATFRLPGNVPNSVAVGDFNLDGNPDLATTNRSTNNVSVLLGNGSGGFVATNFFAGSGPSFIAVGDFNLDGRSDLATANRFSNNVSVLLNRCGVNTAPTASCQNVMVVANASCTANASINNGSSDPDSGDTITLSQSPAGPYPLGSTTVTLTVTDSHGASSSCQSIVTVVDQTAPDTNITSLPPAISGANVSFGFTGSDNCSVSFECKLDSGAWTACISPQAYSGLANGAHTFQVRAKDAAGNVDATPATYPWQVFVNTCGTTVNPATLAQPKIGLPYVQILSASPSGSYTFSLFAGALPPGIQLVNVLGIYSLAGIPTTPGTYNFTLKAKKNNANCEGIRSYTVTIAPTVAPILNCVMKNANGTYTAKFGYDNTTGAVVTIPVGANNYFTPGAQNRGQVTTFQPGRVNNAFSVTFAANGSNLGIWIVKGPDGVTRPVNITTATLGCP